MDWKSALLALRSHLQIAHHVPGRIRVRLPISALPKLKQLDLDPGMLDHLSAKLLGVTEVRTNRAAGTAVISYSPKLFEPNAWRILLEGSDDDAAAIIETKLVQEIG